MTLYGVIVQALIAARVRVRLAAQVQALREARVDWYCAAILRDAEGRRAAVRRMDPSSRVLAAVALDDAEEGTAPTAWQVWS